MYHVGQIMASRWFKECVAQVVSGVWDYLFMHKLVKDVLCARLTVTNQTIRQEA